MQFKNYTVIRNDIKGKSQGSGTAIVYIRNKSKRSYYTNTAMTSFKVLEMCVIKLYLSSNKILSIISAQYSYVNNNIYFRKELGKFYESMNLPNLNNFYVLAGDINALHLDWLVGNCFVVACSHPTEIIFGCLFSRWQAIY